MDILVGINRYSVRNDTSVIVFLCLIIIRFEKEDSIPASKFNQYVKEMVQSRNGNKTRLLLVDMKNGEGLDYHDNLPDSSADPPSSLSSI